MIGTDSRKDDEYNGYHMEAGTVVLSNNYYITTNDAEYPHARRFDPERYQSPNTLTYCRFMNEHVKDVLQGHLGWGSGRRVCIGWNVGWKNMFIVFSRLLYCFDFIEDPVCLRSC
jgi:cytochrome P450